MGLFGLSSPESKVMSSFTTNLLIKLRLIKDLVQKKKKNSQDTCLPGLYRVLQTESVCNFPVKQDFIGKCWTTATATKVLLKPWRSLKGFLPGLQSIILPGCSGTQHHSKPRDLGHFTLLLQLHQGVRKPWQPQVSPAWMHFPPNRAFSPM